MNSVENLAFCLIPFGYLDLEKSCVIGDAVGLFEGDIAEVIRECMISWDTTNFGDIDPVYCVLEHILQHARSVIEEHTGYDFLNDCSGSGSEIYTYGNFMCSGYDYSQCALDELAEVLKNLPREKLQVIESDQVCFYFLKELGIPYQDRWQ